MSKDEETIKLMAETIREGMTKYIGEYVNDQTVDAIRSHMEQIINTFARTADLYPLPEVQVTTNKTSCTATVCFYDPKTGEPLDIMNWISRVKEGFYDRR